MKGIRVVLVLRVLGFFVWFRCQMYQGGLGIRVIRGISISYLGYQELLGWFWYQGYQGGLGIRGYQWHQGSFGIKVIQEDLGVLGWFRYQGYWYQEVLDGVWYQGVLAGIKVGLVLGGIRRYWEVLGHQGYLGVLGFRGIRGYQLTGVTQDSRLSFRLPSREWIKRDGRIRAVGCDKNEMVVQLRALEYEQQLIGHFPSPFPVNMRCGTSRYKKITSASAHGKTGGASSRLSLSIPGWLVFSLPGR